MITYRQLKKSDVPIIADMIADQWASPQIRQNPEMARNYGKMVLYFYLTDSSYNCIASLDDHPVGLVIAAKRNRIRIHDQYVDTMEELMKTLQADPAGAYDLMNFFKLLEVNNEMEEGRIDNNHGAELTLFVVDKQYRRKGLGTRLFKQVLHYFKRTYSGMFYLHSDSFSPTACFYENCGLERVVQQETDISLAGQEHVSLCLYEASSKMDVK